MEFNSDVCSRKRGLVGVMLGSQRVLPKSRQSQYSVSDENSRMEKAVVVTALGDRPLRAMQSAGCRSEMWTKLSFRYAGTSTAGKIGMLSNLVNTR